MGAYGQVRQSQGQAQDCSFRYQGQYEDVETGLYYNRFRYYDPEAGIYISQDPAKLKGGGKLYGCVDNPNTHIDPLGLFPRPTFSSDLKWSGMGHHTVPRAHANTWTAQPRDQSEFTYVVSSASRRTRFIPITP